MVSQEIPSSRDDYPQQPPYYNQPTEAYQQSPQKLLKKSRYRLWIIILAIVGGMLVSCGTPNQQTAQPNVALATATPSQVPTATDTPPPTPTPKPTPKPTALAVRPTPKPTQRPAPTPTLIRTGVNGNPWGYNFSPGSLIYSPPSA